MKKVIILILLTGAIYTFFPAPKAMAMDPVTIALLAPLAMKAANVAKPYLIKGLINGARHMVIMAKDLIGLIRLPVGFTQVVFLSPFGQFKRGMKNLILGSIAPFKFVFHTLLLPVALVGFKINTGGA